jgi:hypothetical protein
MRLMYRGIPYQSSVRFERTEVITVPDSLLCLKYRCTSYLWFRYSDGAIAKPIF